jgi:PTH1 family peptidyl-tRNA hydrolase
MILLVGLGNPGHQYKSNRHNIGFMALDAIVRRYQFSEPKRRGDAFISKGRIRDISAITAKTLNYMNISGPSIAEIACFFKIPANHVVVFHDDLDLIPGKVRAKRGGGAGGHNGLKSLDGHLGKDYWRVRIGIGHPGERSQVTNYVLKDFSTQEQKWLPSVLKVIADETPLLIQGDHEKFMTRTAESLRSVRQMMVEKD